MHRPDSCQPVEYIHKLLDVVLKVGGDERDQGGHNKRACGKHKDVVALLCRCNREEQVQWRGAGAMMPGPTNREEQVQ